MSATPFDLFIELVRLDRSIYDLKIRRDAIKSEVDELNKRIEDAEESLSVVNLVYHNIQKKIDESELELKSIDDQLNFKKTKLDTVSSPKQFESLQTEILQLAGKRALMEDDLLKIYHDLEIAKKNKQEKQKNFEILREETLKSVSNKESLVQGFDSEIATKIFERQPKEQGFPVEWLDKYNSMGQSIANPVVPLVNNACGACFYTPPVSDVSKLKHRQLISCGNCFRILYIEPEKT